jgi:hypothetical protein
MLGRLYLVFSAKVGVAQVNGSAKSNTLDASV